MQAARPRIVINALSARTGGGLTYARNLLRHFDREQEVDLEILVAPDRKHLLPSGPYTFVDCDFAGKNVLQRTLWEAFGVPRLLRERRADVYYVLSGTLAARPPDGCRSVVAFRNTLPWDAKNRGRYPLGYIRTRLWAIGKAQPRSFARADLVILISEYGRSLVEALVPSRAGRDVVIPHGVGDVFLAEGESDGADARWPDGYVLYVSILDVYKAQIEVVEAWAAVRAKRDTREKLVLAGPEYPPYARRVRDRIAELGLRDEVVLTGPIAHDDLPALYRNAKLNVFASRCENCPNILLEAMASGRAILCSKEPPMPEFGLDAVRYFDPSNPAELAEKILEVIDAPDELKLLGEKAKSRGQEFRVDAQMRRTWDCLLELARREPSATPRKPASRIQR